MFIVMPSLEWWPIKAKEAPSPHEVRLTPLDTNPVFQYLGASPSSLVLSIWGKVKFSLYWDLKEGGGGQQMFVV